MGREFGILVIFGIAPGHGKLRLGLYYAHDGYLVTKRRALEY